MKLLRGIAVSGRMTVGVVLFWLGVLCCVTIALFPIGLLLIWAAIAIGGKPVTDIFDRHTAKNEAKGHAANNRRLLDATTPNHNTSNTSNTSNTNNPEEELPWMI